MTATTTTQMRPSIVIVGGGIVGLTTAWRLQRTLDADDAAVTLINPTGYMVYQSLLPEVASGMLEPTDVVVPLRRVLDGTNIVAGRLTDVDTSRSTITVEPTHGQTTEVRYDHLVLALGSETKVLPVPGLVEHAVGFTTVPEALFLRDHVLSRLEAASQLTDPAARRRALTFAFVGGGYSGVEALGELEAMARSAAGLYPQIAPEQQHWLLIEATNRILPMVDEELADQAAAALRRRGVDIRLGTTVDDATGGVLTLSDGDTVPADTLVWAAGVAPNPLLAELGLPVDDSGAVTVDPTLRVTGHDAVWSSGDCAAVPDIVTGGTCPPSAQYALREARHLAANLTAVVRGGRPTPFRYRMVGEMLTLGRHDAVAQLFGRHLHGALPWYLRRAYHIARVPSVRRKLQVWSDWTLRELMGRDVVSLGTLRRPELPLREAAADQSD
ncbi:MAG TPA: NAD(P)/FAD-dependent oxidoreductase [Euzebyales bacterium]|nr:NAD(P)/FAD-dependent oxidoreductase [Euzebyales bacterium]